MLGVYVVEEPFAGHEQGEVIHLDEETATALGSKVREATDEDVNGDVGEEDLGEETPSEAAPEAVTRAVKKIKSKVTEDLVDQIAARVINKTKQKVKTSFPTVPATPRDPNAGIKSTADLCRVLAKAHRLDYRAIRQLEDYRKKAPTGMSESVNADGGYTVVPEWSKEIWDKARDDFNLASLVKQYSTSGNTMNLPTISETSRVDGSRFGGVASYYVGEGNTFTSSKLGEGNVQLVLTKLGVFVYETNELLNDNAYNLDQVIAEKVGLELLFKQNDGVIRGAGTTEPVGVLNQGALITVAKESLQSAATIVFPNLAKMWSRMYYACKKNAVWVMNQEVEQQLIQMTFPNASGTYPAHSIMYNVADEFPLRIFGRPAHVVENCSALGLAGDLILLDPTQLAKIEKPLEVAVSTDFHFNQYETVFRFVYRWDVRSPWTAPLTPYKGNATTSPFIVLQDRGT